jgi:histidine ammonia-lyase
MKSHMFLFGEDHLTTAIAMAIVRKEIDASISDQSKKRIIASSDRVKEIVNNEEVVYGINTGFGPLCTSQISPEQATELQRNILMSHAVGIGAPIADDLVRLMLMTKVHSLARGYSGISFETLSRVLWHLESDVLPIVPEQGSVGASGDLAPLSHLFLPLIGFGQVRVDGQVYDSLDYLHSQGLEPLQLKPKEGLALINGTQFILAHAVKVVEKMRTLLNQEDIIGAMMIEGLLASVKPFDSRLHQVRPYPGSSHVAARLRVLLSESEIVHSHATCARVQDPYSLRCMPQVHGASRETWRHLRDAVETELNGVTDNPLIFEDGTTISGGNFHGQPLALPLDYATLALSEIGNIADRRVYLSLEGDTPGVPKLLLKETGINSGFMILQYATAALASENKSLCFPSSADSIPTSLGQEDHVSMGSISARKALQVLKNVEKIQAIELICAAQAVDYHKPLKSGKIITKLHHLIRSKIPFITRDQVFTSMIDTAEQWISEGVIEAEANRIAKKDNINTMTEWSNQFDK